MSSPLSMLNKTKRAPLQRQQRGREKVPFRRNPLEEFQTAAVDDGDDASAAPIPPHPRHTPASNAPTSKSKAPLKKKELQTAAVDSDDDASSAPNPPHPRPTPASRAPISKSKATMKKKDAPPSDFELMSAMMQRVTLLEQKVKSQAQELEIKNKKIVTLEAKQKVLKESGSALELDGIDDLERKCQQLQNEVHEMKSFLNDYDLTWVGDEENGDSAECEQTAHCSGRGLWQTGSSRVRDFYMNFNLVVQRIMELNILAGEGESFVQSTATGAQLAKKDPIQLKLYSNGIVMFDGPFRSYQEHSTQQCMQDLMDGYFPSELQGRFPNGVPFEVHDRREEEYMSRLPWDTYPGEGLAVCREKDDASNVTGFKTPGKKLTMDQFLNNMPKMVIKAGRVIDVRESLRANLQGSSQSSDSAILIDTAALQAMEETPQKFSSDQPSSASGIITLKVKSEDGTKTYLLKMCLSETIGHLRQYLDKHRSGGLPAYDIISAYPQRRYDDNCRTLQSCDLTVNAALLLRKRIHTLTGVNQMDI